MELRPAVLWTCLLGAALALVQPSPTSVTTSDTFPRPPTLIGCVFQIQSAVTCRWDPGNTSATSYTLKVQRKPSGMQFSTTNNSLKTFTCTTSGTNCTAEIHRSTVRIDFCISVIAHSRNHNISSKVRCQSGRIEVVLSPAILNSAQPVRGSPDCLSVDWSRNFSAFPVANSEIQAGHLNSQIEFTTHKRDAQLEVQVSNVTVTGYKIRVCLFRPDTTYVIRLRHRYWGPASPWSAWSNAVQGRTAEDVPSAAPVLWRQVINPDMNGWRLISLLWKPLPHFLANGRILYYNVTCQTKSAQVLGDHGSCSDLHHARFSCNLLLPAECCSCTLTSSNSAGTSPEARIWLPGTSETELPAPNFITASPLGDRSLEVHWTSSTSRSSMSGFVVEWFAVTDKTSGILHWEILNSSCRNLVLTEGVGPLERFTVSVRVLYGARGAGRNRTLHIYTRQGAPSAGPHLEVQHISGSTVELSWIPVPVELLHGFLCNYTLVYKSRNQLARSILVPAHVHHYTLENLSPGNYGIFVRANTVAGTGQDGNQLNVHIGPDEVSIVTSVAVPLVLTSVVLTMITCLAQMKRVKQKLQQSVPNPSKSSLSHWNPEINFESMRPLVVQEQPEINNCKVILPDKLPNVEQYNRYQSICKLLTYSSHKPSPLPVGILEKEFTRCSAEAQSTSPTAYPSSPCIYSSILLSPTPEHGPTPLQPYPNRPPIMEPSTDSMIELKLQPGKDSESCEFTNEKKPCSRFLEPHQSCTSTSDFNNASHPSFLLYHQKEVSRFNMMLSHQSTTTTSPGDLACLKSSLSPFHHSIFVDLTYLSVQCDSRMSSDI